MPRQRTPTNVLALRGAFAKDPARLREREGEPVPQGEIGDPPAHLDAAEKLCWMEVVGMAHAGTLCASDRLIVEQCARLLNRVRMDKELSNLPLLLRFEHALGRLGLTPADRSRVKVISKPKLQTSEWSEFDV